MTMDVLLNDELSVDGITTTKSCGNNAIIKKGGFIYEGILVKESIDDDTILDYINVHKIELWNTGGKSKYWTMLFFTSSKTDFPEMISKVMISCTEDGGNWFVNFKSGNTKYIVFRDKILRYSIGNAAEKSIVCDQCRQMGISDDQMNWPE